MVLRNSLEHAVETLNLAKRYGKASALVGLNLNVKMGEILVILGPNGSGKTTLLHLLSTVLRPSGGTAKVMGYDIVQQPLKVRETVGISFQEPRGFWRHKPAHILAFHAAVYGIEGAEAKQKVENTLREFELWESKDKMFMTLSGGQAKRLEVAKQFVRVPKVAIFDEPTSMVDLSGKRMIWDKIRQLRENGSTVIVATNEVREAEYLADRITIMSKGEEVVSDSLENLKDSVKGGDIVDITFNLPVDDSILERVRNVSGTERVFRSQDASMRVHVTKSEDWLPLMISTVQTNEVKIRSVKVTEPSLDDVFIHFAGTTLRSEENA
jgi:ABC-2 type transport system ATP-binding protein